MKNSKESMFFMQQNIKNNSLDIQSMVDEVRNWSVSMSKTEKTKISQAKKNEKPKELPPIRNKIDIQESL